MKKLALFDMDRTLTRHGTFTPFLIFAAKRLAPWRLLLLPLFFLTMPGYPLKLYDRKTLKQIGFALLVGRRIDAVRLDRVAHAFADHIFSTGLLPGATASIAAEKAAGAHLVMITASADFYAEQIGKLLGFDHVMGTQQSRLEDGGYSAKITGENCYGAEKINRIEAFMQAGSRMRSDYSVSAYSDHHSDAPMLGWADTAFCVNPNAKLRGLAAERGWTVLDFG